MCFAAAVAIDMVEVLLRCGESCLMSKHHFLQGQRNRGVICEELQGIFNH